MRYIIIVLIVLAIAWALLGCAEMSQYRSNYQYNYYEKRWEMASPNEKLQYNIYENEWRYAE